MKFKAKRNITFRGEVFEAGKDYSLTKDEQGVIGKFFNGAVDTTPKKVEKAAPKKSPIIPPAEEQAPKEEPKAKRK